jgi:hypothetical protein
LKLENSNLASLAGRRIFHQEDEVQRAADSVHFTLGGGRDDGRKGLPEGGDFRGDLLQLAQEVRRVDAVEVEVTGVGKIANTVQDVPAPAQKVGHEPTDTEIVRRVALGQF